MRRVRALREKKGACQPDHDGKERDHVGRCRCSCEPFGNEAGNRPMDMAAEEAVGRVRRAAEGVEQHCFLGIHFFSPVRLSVAGSPGGSADRGWRTDAPLLPAVATQIRESLPTPLSSNCPSDHLSIT